MKEQIIAILTEYPGIRKRAIASYLHVHHFEIISLLEEMVRENLLVTRDFRDMANMEFYTEYYVKG